MIDRLWEIKTVTLTERQRRLESERESYSEIAALLRSKPACRCAPGYVGPRCTEMMVFLSEYVEEHPGTVQFFYLKIQIVITG